MKRVSLFISALTGIIVMMMACSGGTPPPATEPTPTPIPTPTPMPSPPTVAQIFAKVSPSIAYIETDASSGSALLVERGYLVTNAHIVWPNDSVNVTFPNGTVIQNAPLVAWDLLADLAVLGPINVSAQPLALSDTAASAIGSEILVIVYPGSPGDPPQPTLSRGVVVR